MVCMMCYQDCNMEGSKNQCFWSRTIPAATFLLLVTCNTTMKTWIHTINLILHPGMAEKYLRNLTLEAPWNCEDSHSLTFWRILCQKSFEHPQILAGKQQHARIVPEKLQQIFRINGIWKLLLKGSKTLICLWARMGNRKCHLILSDLFYIAYCTRIALYSVFIELQ